jgi:Cd2+/Zn2+-exporting ATPase
MAVAVRYYVNNLDCANCAAKIERRASGIEGVRSANIDLPRGLLLVELEEDCDLNDTARKLSELAGSIEDGVTVTVASPKKIAIKEGHEARGHERGRAEAVNTALWFRLAAAALLAALPMLLELPGWANILLPALGWLVSGYDILIRTGKNILRGEIFDENLLMTLATVGALCIGEAPEAVGVMVFYQIGEWFQDRAVDKSRKNISEMLDLQPETANLLTGGGIEQRAVEEILPGDLIVMRAGEKVPLDCVVTEGSAAFDTSSLTGESLPRDVGAGGELLAGYISLNGAVTAKVTKEVRDSAASRIKALFEEAAYNKAPAEAFITKFARYYTPAVVSLAVALAVIPPLFTGGVFRDWLYRALVFLVVSCPCALVLSVPLSFFGGIGGASRKGVMVKGGNYLEMLAKTDTVVFDKTGTLTKGEFRVSRVYTADGVSEEHLMECAVTAEQGSAHPIALSIMGARGAEAKPAEIFECAGMGLKAVNSGQTILAGNLALMAENNIAVEGAHEATAVYVAENGRYLGCITIEDVIKENSAAAVGELRRLGIKNIAMFTGDSKEAAGKIASAVGISDVRSGLLPDGKTEEMKGLILNKAKNSAVVFVGDGINDAPVLALADVGIAMASPNNQIAVEAADIAIMSKSPMAVCDAIKIARKTRNVVRQNVAFALSVKALALILAALGLAPMWGAVFADVGVSLIAVVNSLRTLK